MVRSWCYLGSFGDEMSFELRRSFKISNDNFLSYNVDRTTTFKKRSLQLAIPQRSTYGKFRLENTVRWTFGIDGSHEGQQFLDDNDGAS